MTTQAAPIVIAPLTPYEPGDGKIPKPANGVAPTVPSPSAVAIPAPRGATRPTTGLSRRQMHAVLTALLEVHTGHRSVAQLRGWLTPALYQALTGRVRARGPRYMVRSLHPCRAVDDAYEVAATASSGWRAYAVTARFEHRKGEWCCTTFAVLEPGITERS